MGTENKGKDEGLRMIKKLESDVSELETALEHANAANADTQKTIKKYHQMIRDAQSKYEEEQRTKENIRDQFPASERRANKNKNALEEARTLLDQADRARRMAEQMVSDTNAQLSELTCVNQSIAGAKSKIESEMSVLHSEISETSSEGRLSYDKSTKAMVDAARLADELRDEQGIVCGMDKERRLLECQLRTCNPA